MNLVKLTIPLTDIAKLVADLPPGKIETIGKWEGNAVITFSSAEINHNLNGPMPFDQWLAANPPKPKELPKDLPVNETTGELPPIESVPVPVRMRRSSPKI